VEAVKVLLTKKLALVSLSVFHDCVRDQSALLSTACHELGASRAAAPGPNSTDRGPGATVPMEDGCTSSPGGKTRLIPNALINSGAATGKRKYRSTYTSPRFLPDDVYCFSRYSSAFSEVPVWRGAGSLSIVGREGTAAPLSTCQAAMLWRRFSPR